MKKKAPTKKEIDLALTGLSRNDQILADKYFRHEMIISLILEYDGKLNKFVRDEIEKLGNNRSEDKEGT